MQFSNATHLGDAQVQGVVPALEVHLLRQQPVRLRRQALGYRTQRCSLAYGQRRCWQTDAGLLHNTRCAKSERVQCSESAHAARRRSRCSSLSSGKLCCCCKRTWTMTSGLEAFMENRKLWKSRSRHMSANSKADSTMPRGVSP